MGSVTDTSNLTLPPYPLHPSIKDKHDPVYATFYNKHILNTQPVHLQPVSASRASGVLIPGGGKLLEVGNKEDILIGRESSEGPDVDCRVFTPEGVAPHEGWPLMIYFHGGGWVLGNKETENTVCTNLCVRSRCVVVTVDYRLAPENPYPAAVHDSWEATFYFLTTSIQRFNLNPSMVAIGGSSAGGNLTAVMTHRLLTYNALHPEKPLPSFKAQLLIVPVTDNTASIHNNASWLENEMTPALPAQKMTWFQNHYLPDEGAWAEPEASPLLYGDDADDMKNRWSRLPRALVVVGELDVLRDEGMRYAERLRENEVNVKLEIMKGMPHPFLAMDEALQQGRDTIHLMVDLLNDVFRME
ncbi:hypothetical protein HYALB_00012599 [Hymenoscyphus albidus]|uniref:Alpha/beta hydrolase fold-3 domain-containing protein n=1 Tax=Hymenoscyphus albidus TaxID=595503 RepID=A0A9N9LS20_9HELO|nr:hypothetical protein HYALB_00012599 [Hymenoscyphus albidus]